ncbi:MAG: MATE family efflux transporter [Caldiserica bacterium]|nr:MAG: MATE family efflux transporter [Caldisericota bacterium]
MTKKFTEGSIISAILSLSIPVVISNLLQTVYNLIDAFWLGRFSREAVASISFSFPILFLFISLGAGITVAGTILVSQFFGKGESKKVDYVATQIVLLVVIFGIIVSLIGIFLSPSVIKSAGAKGEVLTGAISYLKICFAGVIFIFGFFVFQSLLRGIGVVILPMFVVFSTVLLNFFLDPIFILGWGNIFPPMGVKGAAYVTVLSQGIATLILFYVLLKGIYGIRINFKYLKPDISLIKKILSLGVPPALEHSIRAFSFSLLIFIVGKFGETVVASYGIVMRIFGFITIPAVGVAMATTALVGQNMGAEKLRRAEKISIISSLLTFIFMLLLGAVFFIFSKELISFFIPEDLAVINTGAEFIKIVSFTLGFMGLQIVFNGTFRGSGNTKQAMFLTLFTFIILRITIAWLLSLHSPLKEKGVWYSFAISNLIGGITALILFLTGFWKRKRITEEIDVKIKIIEKEAEILY